MNALDVFTAVAAGIGAIGGSVSGAAALMQARRDKGSVVVSPKLTYMKEPLGTGAVAHINVRVFCERRSVVLTDCGLEFTSRLKYSQVTETVSLSEGQHHTYYFPAEKVADFWTKQGSKIGKPTAAVVGVNGREVRAALGYWELYAITGHAPVNRRNRLLQKARALLPQRNKKPLQAEEST